MAEIILKTENLNKSYKKHKILNDINITLKKGGIYALIGENGAGKTTLMKIIVGLSFKTSGEMELFQKTNDNDIQNERCRIGSIIEQPAIYTNMNAYDNMNIARIQKGVTDVKEINRLLNLVGLDINNKKKTKNYSLGMKQRLAIAICLLGSPDFLVLDEPINGLDPKGVFEIRNILIELSKNENVTILISSHNLEELHKTATNFIILSKGKIKKTLTEQQLNKDCKKHISITVDNLQKLIVTLEQKLQTTNYTVIDDNNIKLYDYLDNIEVLSKALLEENIVVTKLSVSQDSLENYYMNIIGD